MQNSALIGVAPPLTGDQTGPQVTSLDLTLAASVDDYTPSGYVRGFTERLRLTPAGGGSTVNGLLATFDGDRMLVTNESAVDSITFAHQAGSSVAKNRFKLPNASNATLAPLACAWAVYVKDCWRFA